MRASLGGTEQYYITHNCATRQKVMNLERCSSRNTKGTCYPGFQATSLLQPSTLAISNHKYQAHSIFYPHPHQGSILSRAHFANQCGSMPFPTEMVQLIQHVQAMTRRKRRAHLYSTRELYSTHVPREEEEEYEEKNTAWLSHQHCHMTRPRQVEPWAPCRTTLWVLLLCARELSKLPAHPAFPTY